MPFGEKTRCWRLQRLAKADEIIVSNLSLVEGPARPPHHDGINVPSTPLPREGGNPRVYLDTGYGLGLHPGVKCVPCESVDVPQKRGDEVSRAYRRGVLM